MSSFPLADMRDMFGTLESILSLKEQLRDAGVPSASIALKDSPSSPTVAHVISINGTEDADTVYQACSISKAITGLGVARLVDRGVLTYDTRIVDYVPRDIWEVTVDPTTEHLMEYVTVGLLLSHRSGLSQHNFPGIAGDNMPTYQDILAGRAPANTPRMKFLSFPGSQYYYSGGGYLLLQILLERITGENFADLMQKLVFEPLEMSRSHYGSLPTDESIYAKAHYAAETLGTENGRGYHGFTELAAAGLWTTPSDLLKAMAAVQISLHASGGFLSQTTARKMLQKESPANVEIGSFGMGWGVDDTFFGHSGDNDPGYVTYVLGAHGLSSTKHTPGMRDLNEMSLAIMTNSVVGLPTLRKLVATIFGVKSWPAYPSLPCGFGSMTDFVPYAAPGGMLCPDIWKEYVGMWATLDGGPEYEIFEHGGGPYVMMQGIEMPMRLLTAAAPWRRAGEVSDDGVFVVEGLEMSLRMRRCDIFGKEIVLMQEMKTLLVPAK